MAESSPTPVLNIAHLQSIVGDNPEHLKELLPIFIVNINELIDKLENAALFDDLEGWRRVAHRMRGVAANFGFVQLQQLCDDAEKVPDISPAKSLFPNIQQAVGHTRLAIEETLRKLS